MKDFKEDSTLEELGVDSLMITEVMSEVRKHSELEISAADFATLLDIKSLRTYLLARGCGGIGNGSTCDPSSDSGEESVSAPPASSATSVKSLTVLRGDFHSDLAKLVASHLKSNRSIDRETNLADEGLDSLLCIELANGIRKDFGASIDMGLLDGDLTYGDLLDMVTSHCQPLMPLVKAKVASTMPGPAPGIEISTNDPPTQAEEGPAPMGRAQQAFENIRFDYDVFTKETGFAGFWKQYTPHRHGLSWPYRGGV